MASPMDAIVALRQIITAIGDIKAWRLEIRKWAYDHTYDPVQAELLEAWVHDKGRLLGGQRRQALAMWAYDHSVNFTAATILYNWAVKAEERPSNEPDDPIEAVQNR